MRNGSYGKACFPKTFRELSDGSECDNLGALVFDVRSDQKNVYHYILQVAAGEG
jgi:hypothetical protein